MTNTVNITNHDSYFYAGSDTVTERYGKIRDGNSKHYYDVDDAIDDTRANMQRNAEDDLKWLHQRLKNTEFWWLRQWWNKSLARGIVVHREKVAVLGKAIADAVYTPVVQFLPECVEIQGTRLMIAQKLYVVDPYMCSMYVFETQSKKLCMYDTVYESYTAVPGDRRIEGINSKDITTEPFKINSKWYFHDVAAAYDMVSNLQRDRKRATTKLYNLEK